MNDSETNEEGPHVPAGVMSRKSGWQGSEMEMEHKRDELRTGKHKSNEAAAVDIRQFQNREVGEGYQARHVVRQPSSNRGSSMKIHDMTGGRFNEKSTTSKQSDTGDRNYLGNQGLRNFRKEIESILSSP